MMKSRILLCLVVLLVAVTFSGCGGGNKTECQTCDDSTGLLGLFGDDCADGLECAEFEGGAMLCASSDYTECAKKSRIAAP